MGSDHCPVGLKLKLLDKPQILPDNQEESKEAVVMTESHA